MSEGPRLRALCLGSRREPPLVLGVPAILGVLVARQQRPRPSGLVWSGDNIFVQGTWRPPPFLVKLLSGKQNQGDRDRVHERDLIAVKQFSL